MAILLKCSACQKKLKAPDNLAGRKVRCTCGAVLAVPSAAAPSPAPVDLSALADGAGVDTGRCPECSAAMPADAVLCVNCGFNRRAGRRMQVQIGDDPSPQAAGDSQPGKNEKKASNAPRAAARSDASAALMRSTVKACVWLVLIGLVVWAGWYVKQVMFFDPQQQALEAKAKLTVGMTVKQVVDALGKKPGEVQSFRDPPKSAGPLAMPLPRKMAYVDNFMKAYTPEDLKFGFSFIYKYGPNDVLVADFSPSGVMSSAEIVRPEDKLLQIDPE